MIELVATAIMTVGSILLFCYWFNYSCRLILSTATPRDYTKNVAQACQLGFQEAQLQLSHDAAGLDRLRDILDLDYAVLHRLMNHSGDAHAGIERRMLAIHYRLMAVWYRATSRVSSSSARRALGEMSTVVEYFANLIGEATASPALA